MRLGDRLHDIGYPGLYYRYIGDNLGIEEEVEMNGYEKRLIEQHGPRKCCQPILLTGQAYTAMDEK